MKGILFREYSTPEQLKRLVEVTVEGDPQRSRIETSEGEIYRTIRRIPVLRVDMWNKIKSPVLIARHVPGLEDFTCPGTRVGTHITEQHGMLFSKNAYEGALFHYDPENKVWGMTNHPVKDDNPFDIPHNVVYHFDEQEAHVSIGTDYCASGSLESRRILRPLAGLVARASMEYALRRVAHAIGKI